MKVLILANNDMGLYRQRRELLERLASEGHDVTVSLPGGEFIPDIEKLGCRHVETDISRHGTNPFRDLGLLRRYKAMLRELGPDIVFTYTIKPNIYGGIACASAGAPCVMNITGLGTAAGYPGLLQRITVALYRRAVRSAQTVFFQNKENEEFFTSKKLAAGKHKMLPGSGVNLSFYEPLEYPADDTIHFAFIARLMKEKGVDQYLDAARALRGRHPRTRFHICGFCEQDYESQVKELHGKGIVVYHGLVRDMKAFYRRMHCIVHPTCYPEGLSNVLLEASACARPVVATDRSGCREVIEDGRNGFLVREGDSRDLIEKLEKFILLGWQEKKAMGLAGRAKAEAEFDREIVVRRYLEEMGQCGGGRP